MKSWINMGLRDLRKQGTSEEQPQGTGSPGEPISLCPTAFLHSEGTH